MPTSVLWVTLIGVWLFVLVPMVLRGRPQARKTTDAVAQTRVVHRGGSGRTASTRTVTRARAAQRAAANADEQAQAAKRRAEAKQAAEKAAADRAADEELDAEVDETGVDDAGVDEMVLEDADIDEAEIEDAEVDDAEIIDVEVEVEETEVDVVSAAELTDQIPTVAARIVDLDAAQAQASGDDVDLEDNVAADGPAEGDLVADDDAEYDDLEDFDGEDAEYEDAEYEDTEYEDGDEYGEVDYEDEYEESAESADVDEEDTEAPPARELRGRGGYGPERLAEREQLQYRERQRMVLGLAVLTLLAVVSAFIIQPWGIIAAVVMVAASAMYLFFLRKTVQAEHLRQAQRAARRRRQQAEDNRLLSLQSEPTYVEPPARLRKPGGAIVLEIDDEDPAFDHLPTFDFAYAGRSDAHEYGEYVDLDDRRTAG
ncbi:gephyrin-like molybdotransferase receptor GlpR [Gordonia sp. (in: high G+C Gram-positive bacteria)]|uniref:divisome protein SepX/GlpR n=1 Tax=Gordonia sp. (in: high G+C Gram-positive bacteria) TaxID=84139 RepID=UPI003C72E8FB